MATPAVFLAHGAPLSALGGDEHAAALRPLRDDGVLVAGSGGIVHNLSRVRLADKDAPVDGWAAEFDGWVAERVAGWNLDELFAYRRLAPHAKLSVPSTEHFDPLFIF